MKRLLAALLLVLGTTACVTEIGSSENCGASPWPSPMPSGEFAPVGYSCQRDCTLFVCEEWQPVASE